MIFAHSPDLDRAWQDEGRHAEAEANADAAEVELAGWKELMRELDEPAPDTHLEQAFEDRYPEPYEGNPYDGTDNSDPGFYSDDGYE